VQSYREFPASDAAAVPVISRSKELPLEWQWEGKATVQYEQMYRTSKPSQGKKIDWIRNSNSSAWYGNRK
jgi:hypothetical protein